VEDAIALDNHHAVAEQPVTAAVDGEDVGGTDGEASWGLSRAATLAPRGPPVNVVGRHHPPGVGGDAPLAEGGRPPISVTDFRQGRSFRSWRVP
jgi:hypothetical protein